MKTKSFFILFLILTIITTFNILPKEKFIIDKFKKYMKLSLEEWNVPGVAVGIINNGYIILGEGFGYRDLKNKQPVTRYTLFPIGSSSKAFTSYVIGKLVDDKSLELNDPVKKYLNDFELYDPRVTEKFRVLDLLIHNSGLPRHDLVWYRTDTSREQLYKNLKYLKNNLEFRIGFQYQNLMYMTAGYLSGRVKGSNWESLVREYIFKPLDMDRSNFTIEESEKSDNYSLPYGEKEGGITQIPFYREMEGIGPAGSINSNIYDMLKWVKLHLEKGKWNGDQIINKDTLGAMYIPRIVVGDTMITKLTKFEELSYPTYGMGWFVQHYRGNILIHHGGNIDGFSAYVSFMPEIGAGVIILTNKGGNMLTMATAFHIYDKLRGKKQIDWNSRLKLTMEEMKKEQADDLKKAMEKRNKEEGPSDPFNMLEGSYNHPAYGDISVSQKEGKLFVKFHKFESSLKHNGGNEFIIEASVVGGMPIKFLKKSDGSISGVAAPLESKVDDIVFTKK